MPKKTDARTVPYCSAIIGDSQKTAKTPRRATAISIPIARAISLPSNHLTIDRETVTPPISVPQPKSAKPTQASFAEAGIAGQKLLKKLYPKPPALNAGLSAYSLIKAPITIREPDRRNVKRTPILSRMIPAKMRKKKNTLIKNSLPP